MKRLDLTVADWFAEGLTTIAVYCLAPDCDHRAVLTLADLPPSLMRDSLGRCIVCAHCGSRSGHVMRGMNATWGAQRRERNGANTKGTKDDCL
ncbi:hypothetical protein MEX01_39630 [Methylorubrum extorquens]|nr:hypothetical protein MEX01_39630 [Methylorubrum extorquens]